MVADGVGCDSSFIKITLCDVLLEKYCHVGLVDRNKNGKNSRYQLLGGLSIVMMEHHVVETIMFRLENVCKDLWRVKYVASYILFITLDSPDTVEKYILLVDIDHGEVVILCALLYLFWSRLFAMN